CPRARHGAGPHRRRCVDRGDHGRGGALAGRGRAAGDRAGRHRAGAVPARPGAGRRARGRAGRPGGGRAGALPGDHGHPGDHGPAEPGQLTPSDKRRTSPGHSALWRFFAWPHHCHRPARPFGHRDRRHTGVCPGRLRHPGVCPGRLRPGRHDRADGPAGPPAAHWDRVGRPGAGLAGHARRTRGARRPGLRAARAGRRRLRPGGGGAVGRAPAGRGAHGGGRRVAGPGVRAADRRRDDRGGGPVTALELAAAGKQPPGSPPVTALRSVTLAIADGEFAAIVGPSGSGKSTLLALAGTLERPTSGEVRIGGTGVGQLADRELAAVRAYRIGFVFQQFFLVPTLSAVDNVASGLLYRGIPAAQRRDAAATALATVGLAHRMWHRPGEMSGGERQRTAIARALIGRPAIILADEPTGSLDTATGLGILTLLTELNAAGSTILVATHNPEIAHVVPRTIRLRDGAVESDTGRA